MIDAYLFCKHLELHRLPNAPKIPGSTKTRNMAYSKLWKQQCTGTSKAMM